MTISIVASLSKLCSLMRPSCILGFVSPLGLERQLRILPLVSLMQDTIGKAANVLHILRSLRTCTYGEAHQWCRCILGLDVVQVLEIHTATNSASLFAALSADIVVQRIGGLVEIDLVDSS